MTPSDGLLIAAVGVSIGATCLALAVARLRDARALERRASQELDEAIARTDRAATELHIAQRRFEDAARMAHPAYSPYPDNWNRP